MRSFRKRDCRARARAATERKSNTRLEILPRPEKSWLLAGTALVTSTVLASFAMSGPARAINVGCAEVNSNQWYCAETIATGNFDFSVNSVGQIPWNVYGLETPPSPFILQEGRVTINNYADENGDVLMEAGTSITNTKALAGSATQQLIPAVMMIDRRGPIFSFRSI